MKTATTLSLSAAVLATLLQFAGAAVIFGTGAQLNANVEPTKAELVRQANRAANAEAQGVNN